MTSAFTGLVIIIPTRNRSEMAFRSLRSALAIPAPLRVLVSDNSTNAEERRRLAALCDRLDDGRVVYITPPTSLPQGPHWEWAINHALAAFPFNHFTLVTDRILIRPALWPRLIAAVQRRPDRVLTYSHDSIDDHVQPIRLTQQQWSGRIVPATSARFLSLASQADFKIWLPRLYNCIVPRHVFDAIRFRYSHICRSRSPDFNFCFKCLTIVPYVNIYDASPIVDYAKARSIGNSAARGVMSADRLDHLEQARRFGLTSVAPAPEIRSVGNAIVSEYLAVRYEGNSDTMPDIDRHAYIRMLAHEIRAMENPQQRDALHGLLLEKFGPDLPGPAEPPSDDAELSLSERVLRKVEWTLGAPAAQPAWTTLARAFGTPAPRDHRYEFATAADAIRFAVRRQVLRSRGRKHYVRTFSRLDLGGGRRLDG
jgi:hypothetical protein